MLRVAFWDKRPIDASFGVQTHGTDRFRLVGIRITTSLVVEKKGHTPLRTVPTLIGGRPQGSWRLWGVVRWLSREGLEEYLGLLVDGIGCCLQNWVLVGHVLQFGQRGTTAPAVDP
jgi:hypothetical protein